MPKLLHIAHIILPIGIALLYTYFIFFLVHPTKKLEPFHNSIDRSVDILHYSLLPLRDFLLYPVPLPTRVSHIQQCSQQTGHGTNFRV